jgi:hypothetical protein
MVFKAAARQTKNIPTTFRKKYCQGFDEKVQKAVLLCSQKFREIYLR